MHTDAAPPLPAHRLSPAVSRAVVGALLLAAVTAAAMFAVTLDVLAWAARDTVELPWSADIEWPLRLATALVWLTAAVLWATWLWLALRAAAPHTPLRADPALTVTLLAVPVVGWVAAHRALDDLRRAGGHAESARTAVLLRTWWPLVLLFLAAGTAAAILTFTVADAVYIEDQLAAYWADAVAYGLGVVAAALGAVVSWRVSRTVSRLAPASAAAGSAGGAPADRAAVAAQRAPDAARWSGWAAGASAALAVAYLLLTLWARLASPSAGALSAAELAAVTLTAVPFVLFVVLWLRWFHAACGAYHALHGGPTAWWLTVTWFIPPLFLVVPWRALARLLAAAGAGTGDLRVAWGSFVAQLAVTVPVTAVTLSAAPDASAWGWYGPLSAVAYVLGVVGLLATRRITSAVAALPR